jgi:tetratricopeptide (TPR) repeat protein
MINFKKTLIILSLLPGIGFSTLAQSVKIEQRPIVLPTYEIGAPDVNPVFFTGRVYQGAQGHIYPYPLYDILTDNKIDKSYNGLYVENEYINVCVLPEIGGRILSATDKTNGYEIFYRQTGIKPALIGMLGAWLSGGVEWNFPHHHRPSSYMAIDWKLEENQDGSKTIWVGETELRQRLKWSIGITVYPGRSWVEAKVKIMNRTPFIQSMLYWANVSVHTNKDYEVIFPPSTLFGTDHSKVAFTRWPNGEVTRGGGEVNLAWWKNFTAGSRSIFAWNFEDDFLAGYDHGKKAGTVHVANHHIVGGKKFFLWGNNPSGEMWDKMLSDNDGHYLELMVGAYSDNQPDYSWIGPGETREFTQKWYPIRDIESVMNATDDAAVNLRRISGDKVFIGFNTSAKFNGAKAVLKNGDRIIFEQGIDIDPATPFIKEIGISPSIKDTDLRVALLDAKGNELVAYQPVELKEEPMPDVVESTKPVSEYNTVEELYLAGLRIEQFHNARLDPMLFYNEALRRDSADARVNTVVGIRLAKRGEWEKAEKYLRRAIARLTKDYTVTKDPEAHYYLALSCHFQGKLKEAADQYWKATWYPTFRHPAYFSLAQIASISGDYSKAAELLTQSINEGTRDTKALVFQAWLMRKIGKIKEAGEILDKALAIDPLDYFSLAEKSIIAGTQASFVRTADKNRGTGIIRLQELLEVAVEYGSIGAYQEAADLLLNAVSAGEPYATAPLVYYYAGFYMLKAGKKDAATELFVKAAAQPSDYCFPFRLEEIEILNTAAQHNPADAKAMFYLGNLYYYHEQKANGIKAWEKSAEINPAFAPAGRNLGFAYGRDRELTKAIEKYEQSIKADPTNPRLFIELDAIYEQSGKASNLRLALLEKNIRTVLRHDDAVIRLLTLYNETGAYDKAIRILKDRHFHVWEGGGQVHSIYVDAHLLKGISLLNAGKYDSAIREFETADLYPENLEVGRPAGGGHSIKGYYYMAQAWKRKGNTEKASEAFRIASQQAAGRRAQVGGIFLLNDNTYFRAQALKETGAVDDANLLIRSLKDELKKQLESPASIDEYSKFGEDGSRAERLANLHYLSGLVHLYEGDATAARAELAQALKMNPNLIWAKKLNN